MRTLPFFVFLISLGTIFYITGNKVNQYGASDPLLTLPTSQALVATGHTYLTNLKNRAITPDGRPLADVVGNYQAAELNGEIIDVYSPGPAILAMPLTAVLVQVGYDLNDPDTNMAVQNRLAFLTSAVVLLLLYFLCRVRLTIIPSLVISHITFFGSSIFANMGLAYFNLNIALIFTCWVLLLLAILEVEKQTDQPKLLQWLANSPPALMGILIGVGLFLAFIGRPSAAILIVVTFGYLIKNQRKASYFALGSALVCLVGFSFWSVGEYGELLPIYFNPEKSNDAPLPIWVGVLGNLFSPSRGMFIYMPWLLLFPAVMLQQKRVISSKLSVWIGIWFALLLITVSRSVIWWGGASFGPRLMAEIVPGLILLGVFSWADFVESEDAKSGKWRPIMVGLFLLTGTFSIWVNSYQPFFNIYTGGAWQDNITGFPIDEGDSVGPFFRWDYSQWTADADQICEQNADMTRNIFLADATLFRELQPFEIVNEFSDHRLILENIVQSRFYDYRGQLPTVHAVLEGFLLNQGETTWSLCERATVYFIPADLLLGGELVQLTITGRTLNDPPIDLFINDVKIATLTDNAELNDPLETTALTFDSSLLNPDQINAITFSFPESGIARLPNYPAAVRGRFGYQLSTLTLNAVE